MDTGTKAFIDSLEKLEKQDEERSKNYRKESDLRNISIIASGVASLDGYLDHDLASKSFDIYKEIVELYEKKEN